MSEQLPAEGVQWEDPEMGDCDYCDSIDVAVRPDNQGLLACRRCAALNDGDGA